MCLVELPSGRLELVESDFLIPGPIDLGLERYYRSTNIWLGDLGNGWSHSLTRYLWRESDGTFMFRAADGRRIPFQMTGEQVFAANPIEKMALASLGPAQLEWSQLRNELPAGAWAVYSPETPTLLFDARESNGRFTWRAMADRSKNLVHVIPDERGLPREIHAPWSRTLRCSHDDRGLLTQIDLVASAAESTDVVLTRYEYDGAQNLVAVHDAAGTRKYEYQDRRMVRHYDRCGAACSSSYDAQGRCSSVSGPDGVQRRTYQYDDQKGTVTCRNSLGHAATYKKGPNDLIVETKDEAGGVSKFEYNDRHQMTRITDQTGNDTTIVYKEDGIPVSKIGPDGNACAMETNDRGEAIRHLSAAGVVVNEYERDNLGRVTKMATAGKGSCNIKYAADGSISNFQTPFGKQVELAWSPDRCKLIESDAKGMLTLQVFDPLGNLIVARDAQGAETQYDYDQAGQLARVTNPDGTSQQLRHDPEGRLLQLVDESGNTTRFEYDAAGRRVAVILPTGEAVRSEYDSESRLVAVQDIDGRWHRLEYDPRGLVTRQQFTDGRVETYEHDPRGMTLAIADAPGSKMTGTRDPAGRLVQIDYPDESTKIIELNEDGVWQKIEWDGHVLARELSPEGQPEREQTDDFVLYREYGPAGELTSVTDHFGRRVAYVYNDVGLVESIEVCQGRWDDESWLAVDQPRVHQFKYDRVGNLTLWETPAGTVEQRRYDQLGQLTEQVIRRGEDQILIRRQYVYDATGKVTEIRDSNRGTSRFTFDEMGRLIFAQTPDGEERRFAYNAAGDRVTDDLEYAAGHRVVRAGEQRLEYDQRGFLVQRRSAAGTDSMTYTAHGLLKSYQRGVAERIDYAYDGLGRLIMTSALTAHRSYCWNNLELWLTLENDEPVDEFVYFPQAIHPCEQRSRGKNYSVHTDHLGRVLELIDDEGNIAWSDSSDLWADGRPESGRSGTPSCPITLPGQLWDRESQLYYNRYRFYWSRTGQYVTPDPVGLWGGLDAYSYVRDPVNLMDPLGLKCRGKTDDKTLYRGDKQPPDEICKQGFKPRNPNAGLTLYQHADAVPSRGSNWISTSYDEDVASRFAGSDGYIYVIDNPGCGQEVDCDPDVMAEYGDVEFEKEIAFNKAIPPGNIQGYYSKAAGKIGFTACP